MDLAETAAAKAREAHELAVALGDPGAILDTLAFLSTYYELLKGTLASPGI